MGPDEAEVERIACLPFTRILQPDDAGGYSAAVLEFPGCVSDGRTPALAAERIEEALRLVIESMLAAGTPIPAPMGGDEGFSGRLALRIPPSMHARVSRLAAGEGVSLNRWLSNAIAFYAGVASSPADTVTRVAESGPDYMKRQ